MDRRQVQIAIRHRTRRSSGRGLTGVTPLGREWSVGREGVRVRVAVVIPGVTTVGSGWVGSGGASQLRCVWRGHYR